MARLPAIAQRAEELLGTAVVATTPVAGGDVATATRLRLSDGRSALAKTRPGAPADFFAAEARGLAWLAAAGSGGVEVPEVLAVDTECLILSFVETGRPGTDAADDFGRALARTHLSAPGDVFGLVDGDGYIATLPLQNRPAGAWPEFFATRRVLPYLKLARDRGTLEERDAGSVEAVVRRIEDLAGPAEPPARLHGDLWSGNVLWGADGRVRVVDPAAHAGHRESDLAMLALFGCPQLQRVRDAYEELAPLAPGWEDRVSLHQLFPLLVHACLFGGGYGPRAGEAARSLL